MLLFFLQTEIIKFGTPLIFVSYKNQLEESTQFVVKLLRAICGDPPCIRRVDVPLQGRGWVVRMVITSPPDISPSLPPEVSKLYVILSPDMC